MRLDRFLSLSGNGSRRDVKALIKDKRIKVNNLIITSPNFSIDEYKDIVMVDEIIIEYHKFYYIILNKPQGFVSATKRENNYPPVTDLVAEYDFAHLFPVGRLDVDSTGLLLLTNNGSLAHRLLSPKYHVDKVYEVEVDFTLKNDLIAAFKNGILLNGEKTLPAELEILDEYHARVTLHEGKFHQVKRMFLYFGYKVISLNRVRFSFLTLGSLKQGEYRLLNKEEIETLQKT